MGIVISAPARKLNFVLIFMYMWRARVAPQTMIRSFEFAAIHGIYTAITVIPDVGALLLYWLFVANTTSGIDGMSSVDFTMSVWHTTLISILCVINVCILISFVFRHDETVIDAGELQRWIRTRAYSSIARFVAFGYFATVLIMRRRSYDAHGNLYFAAVTIATFRIFWEIVLICVLMLAKSNIKAAPPLLDEART